MSQTLYFEKHESVIVADGFGFKAPKDWGKRVNEPAPEVQDSKLDFEIDPTSKLSALIHESELDLARITAEGRAKVSELRDAVADLDVKALVTSGAGHLELIEGQRNLKVTEIRRIEAETETQIAHQKERVARLKTLRSEKRKELL